MATWSFSTSLRARLVVFVGLLVVALAAPLLVLLPAKMDGLSQRWADRRLIGIARLQAARAWIALDTDDQVEAEALLRNLGSAHGVLWAALLRPDGSPLARWNDPPGDLVPFHPGEERVEHQGGAIVVRVPVRGRTEQNGTLALAFDPAELRARPRETLLWMTTGAGLALLIGIAAAYLIGTIVARPLRQATDVAERIASGDFTASNDLQTSRRDEAGALARAFESMLARLYEQQLVLARKNAQLGEQLAELRRTQEQLVVADRRVSVGRLAAGVAHEVNNPLAYVRANLEFIASSLTPLVQPRAAGDEPGGREDSLERVKQALAEACQGADRIRQIVHGLKSFSRDDDGRRERLHVTTPLEAAIAMAAGEIRQRARLVRLFGETPPVDASEVRLAQVFLNLLINAADALPEGASDRHTVTASTRTGTDGSAVVEVQDTGSGIAPENREKLFQAFFTTKPAGVGTGLGLSISQGIVRALGGRIEVESEVGRGSTFRVILPPAPETAVPAEKPAAPPARGCGTTSLLVVDDEALVGKAFERALGSEFRVVTATSASSALARLATDRFQHVLCDLAMPDMSGPMFHAELKRRWPAIADRVIFMTGGAFTPAIQSFAATWTGALLQKPVDMDHLRRLIAPEA
ncbi:MAG: hypothetical protein A2V77_21755 [Anaeromyxobacter sp. RBG_16_69_14]|nr:MAG: hypothetical protein A2V77_21755 [Anaeromyxobacter sp. RBG_16_69_14]